MATYEAGSGPCIKRCLSHAVQWVTATQNKKVKGSVRVVAKPSITIHQVIDYPSVEIDSVATQTNLVLVVSSSVTVEVICLTGP